MRCTTVRQTVDAREGFCWKGSVSPSEDPNLVRQGKATALTDIHAVQLVAERLSSSDGRTDYSTEINLVLHDGSRRHLVDHGGGSISDDAERLARFLKVPVLSMFLLGLSVKELPIGTAYAIWVGIGTFGAGIFGILIFHEPVTPLGIASLAFIFLGNVGMKIPSS